MSRSYRKTSWEFLYSKHRSVKKDFNRRIRRGADVDFEQGVISIPNGGAYRKANESWEICDGERLGPSWPEYRDECLARNPEANVKLLQRQWIRRYKGK